VLGHCTTLPHCAGLFSGFISIAGDRGQGQQDGSTNDSPEHFSVSKSEQPIDLRFSCRAHPDWLVHVELPALDTPLAARRRVKGWAWLNGKSFTRFVREGRYEASWNCVCNEPRQSVDFSDVEPFVGE